MIGLLPLLVAAWAGSGSPDMARVGPGVWEPLYPASDEERRVDVPAFLLDRQPVTNGEFLAFVTAHPRWRREQAPPLYVDDQYLALWAAPLELGPEAAPDQPVVHVSWFAARAYCRDRGARLPTEAEWELAAMASETDTDATDDPVWRQRILDWYAKPANAPLPTVGRGPANAWGVRDLHGVVWEWVEDFGNSLVATDPREGGDEARFRFCGAGAVQAQEADDYASFMRLAFRSSLKARFGASSLGFRCAADGAP